MQKIFYAATILTSSNLFAYAEYAEVTSPLTNIVSTSEINNIVNSLVNELAPSGTSVSQVALSGTATFDSNHYLKQVDITSVTFHVSYLLFITDDVRLRFAFSTPDGDCNNVKITHVESSGTNFFVDDPIKNYLNKNSTAIAKNFLIKKSSLSSYCKVKPQFNTNELIPDVHSERNDVQLLGDVYLY